MRRTLARWLGPAAASADLPVPALINFDARPGTDLAAVGERIAAIAPGARVAAHRETVRPLLRSLVVLQWVALGLVVLLTGAAAAAVVLAARGALDTHRSTIEVMHGVGATDLQVAHLFQRKIAIDALIGSLLGAGAAALVLLLLATGASFAGRADRRSDAWRRRSDHPVAAAAGAHCTSHLGRPNSRPHNLAPGAMITRAAALLILLYAIGFVLFAVTLGKAAPASAAATDAAVVLTGGSGRIEHAIRVLRDHKAKRLLVAGADPSVTKTDIARRLGGSRKLIQCCVDLGSESVDTRSNAEEAGRWLEQHHFRSVRLITSDWHMRRARYEFHKALGGKYRLVTDAVRTEPRLLTLFGEYNKYVLRRLAVWADI